MEFMLPEENFMSVDQIKWKLNQSETLFIDRIDIRYVAHWDGEGFLFTASDKILFGAVKGFISEITKIYGDYRPIQVIQPEINGDWDYSIFVDMAKTNKEYLSRLGLLYFEKESNISIKSIKKSVMEITQWELALRTDWLDL
jgi:hypothetical protein